MGALTRNTQHALDIFTVNLGAFVDVNVCVRDLRESY